MKRTNSHERILPKAWVCKLRLCSRTGSVNSQSKFEWWPKIETMADNGDSRLFVPRAVPSRRLISCDAWFERPSAQKKSTVMGTQACAVPPVRRRFLGAKSAGRKGYCEVKPIFMNADAIPPFLISAHSETSSFFSVLTAPNDTPARSA
jgi:hypothetical protein